MHIFNENELKLKLPFGLVIAGPSTSGKSTIVQKIIERSEQLIQPPPISISYYYGQYNSLVPILQKEGISVFAGVPTDEQLANLPKPALIILDDLLYTIENKILSELFTKKAHHLNLGVIFIAQDIFDKKIKTARVNSQYLILTRAPSSALSIRNLGLQLFPGPGQLAFFLDAYNQATREKYSYIFIDLHPASDPKLRLRSNIFNENSDQLTIFLPKNGM
jgi:GTPase SAR1 family protein